MIWIISSTAHANCRSPAGLGAGFFQALPKPWKTALTDIFCHFYSHGLAPPLD